MGIGFFVIMIGVFGILWFLGLFAPQVLQEEIRVEVKKGYSLSRTADILEEQGVIASSLGLKILAKRIPGEVKAGEYVFGGILEPQTVLERLYNSDYGDIYINVTLPEGSTHREIAEIFGQSDLPLFDKEKFIQLTQAREGYLFPDTYSFLPSDDTEAIIAILEKEFMKKFDEFALDIEKSGRSREDIITMASLIEKEATGDLEEQKTVAGILWKRLDEGKLLQIDAPFLYINGQVRAADLRKDGPFNTYTRTGLTPTPIGNPGRAALEAAINPITTSYYFYLHAPDGKIHYGRTYNNHINNINKYLR